uniref:Bm14182 n=1 Tax=Brugia malayi TaxID=6279 RepID=A0A0J9XTD6_BRUMA|nr:Bm14182 [Brugia malayi]
MFAHSSCLPSLEIRVVKRRRFKIAAVVFYTTSRAVD